jgi:Fe-S-cluster containining protein
MSIPLTERKVIWQEIVESFENIKRIFDIMGGCRCCGNCCRKTPVEVTPTEIARIARYLKISVGEIFNKFARWHNEYIYLKTPCPFIKEDNKCGIYLARPLICKFYPIRPTGFGFIVAENPSCSLSQVIFQNLAEYANSPEIKRESERIPPEVKSSFERHVKDIISEEAQGTERVPQEADKTTAKSLLAIPYTLKTFADWSEKNVKK